MVGNVRSSYAVVFLIIAIAPWALLMVVPESGRHPTQATYAGFLLCGLASVTTLAMYGWRRSTEGERVANALGLHVPLLAIHLSALLTAVAIQLLELVERNTGNVLAVVTFSSLVWHAGRVCSKVPPNRVIGFRTKRARSDQRAWTTVNSKWGRRLQLTSIASLLGLLAGDSALVVAAIPIGLFAIAFAAIERNAEPLRR